MVKSLLRPLISGLANGRIKSGSGSGRIFKVNFGTLCKEINKKNQSYVHMPGQDSLLGVTLGELIDLAPERFGDRVALIDCPQGIRKTYIQYVDDINNFARGLLALNLNRGDRIAIWSPNRYEWAVTQFAAAKAGLILITLNYIYTPSEVSYCMEKLGIRAVVMAETFRTQNYYDILSQIVPELQTSKPGQIKSKRFPNFDTLIMMSENSVPQGAFRFNDVMNAGGSREKTRLEELKKEIQFDDAVNVLFTSGTTGRPKAATLNHFGIINNSIHIAQSIGYFQEPHTICCNVPLFHCFGSVAVTTMQFVSGVNAVFPSEGFNPEESLKAIEREKCTSIYGTPTMFIDLLTHPNFNKTDLSSIKVGAMAGSVCPPNLVKQVMEKLNCPGLIVAYGITELSPLISAHDIANKTFEQLMTTVGKVVPATEVKIVDSNNKIVPLGTPGEICVRGYQIMNGYWADEEKTKEAIRDRWYHTGDIGTLTADHHLTISGRIKDMIIRGGENIYPREIEDFLLTLPKINAVEVIGVPDERLGEEVCAWVKLKVNEKMTSEELREACKGHLSYFKIPRYIQFVEDFPKTTSGKVQKFVMRQEMLKVMESSAGN